MSYGREKAVRFGKTTSLVGVVTEAAPGTDMDGKPALVLLNSGILHRVGSCRIHVRLARALSAAGFTTLRFDYSGIGDSEQRRDSLPFEESAVVETREAMDYLATTKGAQQFILLGLCSGADMAHETARQDQRIVGLMMIDAWIYKTKSWYLHHYGPKLLNWSTWQNAIRIRWQMLRGTYRSHLAGDPHADGVEYEVPKYVRVFPPHDRVEADLQDFVRRGIDLYCMWTGGLETYNHRGQYAESFRGVSFGKLLREEYVPDADHIITGLHHQRALTDNVVAWACGVPRAAPALAPTARSA